MTAIVMIFEMTRDYNVIVPLVLAVAIAVGVRRWLIKDNIYTVKLRHRGKPIPLNRHTNMYLVQPIKEVMAKNFVILPLDTPVQEAISAVSADGGSHIIASDGPRIAGFVRLGTIPYQADRFAGQTLRAILSNDFVIAPATNIMNSVITRMNNRNRSCAIIVSGDGRIPRPDDVVGVVDSRKSPASWSPTTTAEAIASDISPWSGLPLHGLLFSRRLGAQGFLRISIWRPARSGRGRLA